LIQLDKTAATFGGRNKRQLINHQYEPKTSKLNNKSASRSKIILHLLEFQSYSQDRSAKRGDFTVSEVI
jgi:hypothetical protein